MFDVQSIKQRKAIKQYTCQLCGKPILKGGQYIHETFKGDGGFKVLRRHIHCDAMLGVYNREYNCDTEYYNDHEATEALWDEICKQICDKEQQNECSMCDLYGCELAQRKVLDGPILNAAIQSARDHYEWDDL